MSNKHLAVLLSPAIIFLVIAAGDFVLSQQAMNRPNPDQERQRFENFVKNVQSGKWQLTTDRWLVGMRSQHRLVEAERGTRLQLAETMRSGVWHILAGIGFQAIAVLWVRNDCRKQKPLTTPCS